MEDRKEGYYWAMHKGGLVVTEYTGDDDWCLMDYSGYLEEEDFDEIGERIEPPIPKHVCSFTRTLEGGKDIKACECGAILIPAGFIKPGDRKVASVSDSFWNGISVVCTDGTVWQLKTVPFKRWERLA